MVCKWVMGFVGGVCVRSDDIQDWTIEEVEGGWGVFGHLWCKSSLGEELLEVGRVFADAERAGSALRGLLEAMGDSVVVDVGVMVGAAPVAQG